MATPKQCELHESPTQMHEYFSGPGLATLHTLLWKSDLELISNPVGPRTAEPVPRPPETRAQCNDTVDRNSFEDEGQRRQKAQKNAISESKRRA